MARYSKGWTKTYRSFTQTHKFDSFDLNPFVGDSYLQSIFTFLVNNANVKEGSTIPKGFDKPLERGQILLSMRELMVYSGGSDYVVKSKIKRLLELSAIICEKPMKKMEKNSKENNRSNRRFGTLITIVNYNKYQGCDLSSDEGENYKITRISQEKKQRKRNESAMKPPASREREEREENLRIIKEINKENLETEESNIYVDQDLNKYLDVLFSEKVKKPRNKKSMIKTWTSEDPLAKIFEQLNQEKKYRSVFDYPKDKAHIKDCGIEFDLSLKEMESIAKDYAIYFGDKENSPKSPRSSLRNFCKNVAKRKAEKSIKTKSKESDYLRGGLTSVEYVAELQEIIDGKRD